MIAEWVLTGMGGSLQRFRYRVAGARQATSVSPVLTVHDLCRRLGKSRRQVYRYLRAGRLRPCGRVLGQWLFGQAEVGRFSGAEVPRWLRPPFWDARLSELSVDAHRDYILGRVLEHGNWQALRWAFRTYSTAAVRRFLRGRGAVVLSPRARTLWNLHLGLTRARMRPSWRQPGWAWGGIR